MTENETYLQILRLAMIVGLVVAVKRLVVGLFLGRQTFVHYGEELAKVMKRMVLVGEVAALSREPLPRTNSEYLHDADQFEQFTGKNLTAFMSDEDGSTVSMHSVKDLPDVDAAKTLPKIDSTRAINLALAQQSASSANQNATLGGNQSGNPKNQPFSSGAAQSTSRTDKDHTPPPSPGAPSISHAIPTSVGGDGGVFTPTSSQTMMDLLERWEEPERSDNGMVRSRHCPVLDAKNVCL